MLVLSIIFFSVAALAIAIVATAFVKYSKRRKSIGDLFILDTGEMHADFSTPPDIFKSGDEIVMTIRRINSPYNGE